MVTKLDMCVAYLNGSIEKLDLANSIVTEQYDMSRQTMSGFFLEAKTRSSAILTYGLQLKVGTKWTWRYVD